MNGTQWKIELRLRDSGTCQLSMRSLDQDGWRYDAVHNNIPNEKLAEIVQGVQEASKVQKANQDTKSKPTGYADVK